MKSQNPAPLQRPSDNKASQTAGSVFERPTTRSGWFDLIPALLLPAAMISAGIGACSDGQGGGEGCENPPILKGPFASGMTETGITIRWDGEADGCSEVTLLDGTGRVIDRVRGGAEAFDLVTEYGVGWDDDLIIPDVPGRVYLHEVKLTGLQPGTCYGYRIDGASPGSSHRFCTAKPAGEKLRIAVIGDTVAATGVMDDLTPGIAKENPDFIVHTGDMQYYSSIVESWASWAPRMQPFFSIAAVLPAVGNHEHESEAPHEYEDYYARLFRTPGEGTTEWYTYSSGGVHFFVLDTESDIGPGTEQDEWLQQALEAAKARDDFRFSVLVLHRPIYTLGDHAPRMEIRNYLEPLYEPYDVKLVLVGHQHVYERFELDGVISLTTGGGGARPYNVNARADQYPEDAARRKAGITAYHFVMLEIDDETITGRAIDRQGEVIDTFELSAK